MTTGGKPDYREPRTPLRTRVKVRCDNWDRVMTLYTQNISRGGMFVKLDSPPEINAEVQVQLALPDGRMLDLAARVAHVITVERAAAEGKSPGAGLSFHPLTGEQKTLVESVIALAQKNATDVTQKVKINPDPVSVVQQMPSANVGAAAATTGAKAPAAKAPAQAQAKAPSPAAAKPAPQAAPISSTSTPMSDPPPSISRSEGSQLIPLLDHAEAQLLATIELELGRLRSLRPWEVLGVAPDATEESITAAYRKLCKRYHPDVFAGGSASVVRDSASDCFILVRKAYDKMQTDRRAADANRPKTPPKPPGTGTEGSRVGPLPVASTGAAAPFAPTARAGASKAAPPVPISDGAKSPKVPVEVAPGRYATPMAGMTAMAKAAPKAAAAPPPSATPNKAPPPSPAPTPASSSAKASSPVVRPPVQQAASPPSSPLGPGTTPAGGRTPVREPVMTPTSLSHNDLFGDLGPSDAAGHAAPMEAAAPTGGTSAAAEEGMKLLEQKQFGLARTKLAEALRREPRDRTLRVAFHLCVGYDLQSQGRADDARKQFESALALAPNHPQAMTAMRALTDSAKGKSTMLKKIIK